jgi:hypothetical protein
VTSTDSVSDLVEVLWKVESDYGPVLEEAADRVAVARALARAGAIDQAAVERAFEAAGRRPPRRAYVSAVVRQAARVVARKSLLDLILDFRQHALGALSRRFGGKRKGREDELRDYLLTYLTPRGYTEAEAGKGNTDILIPSIPAIIECKVWDDEEYHELGLEQLRRYIHTERPKEAYMVVFGDRDPLPSIVVDHDQAIAGRPVLSGLAVPVVVVPFEVDYPSKARANEKRRAKRGKR